MKSIRVTLLLSSAMVFVLPAFANAADPVAMVEQSTAASALAPFDYLSPGQSIALGTQDRIVIDYFGSCLRETITGGVVTVGTAKSAVDHGRVQRERVACDGGQLGPGRKRSDTSTATVFRAPPRPGTPPETIAIEHRIYARCPVVDVTGADSLAVERLDRPEAPVTFLITPERRLHGGFYDFAAGDCRFVAGGTYRLTVGSRSVVFAVDPSARRAIGALASRILFF